MSNMPLSFLKIKYTVHAPGISRKMGLKGSFEGMGTVDLFLFGNVPIWPTKGGWN